MRRNLVLTLTIGALALAFAPSVHAQNAMRSGFDANTLAANDDGSTGLVGFGFQIDFFGLVTSGGWVNNNGNVTLDGSLGTYTPFSLITTGRSMFAPFFADVDTRNATAGSPVQYGTGTVGGRAAWGASYRDVCYYNQQCTPRNTFQMVLTERYDTGTDNFDIEFNYGEILWETGGASGGSSGLGGNSARVGWTNGSTDAVELAGSAINGALLDGGLNALISDRLNSDRDGRYVWNVREGQVVVTSVPEPGTMLLLVPGLLGMAAVRRRREDAID